MIDHHMERREFLLALGGLLASTCLPSTAAQLGKVVSRTPLARPLNQLREHYDVVVIGSGYGGAVMAARLASGRRLCVLERGKEWLPDDFPSDLTSVLSEFRLPSRPLGLFDYRAGATLDVLTGSGLGGTSLINANVVMAPDRDVFARWPVAIQNAYATGQMDRFEDKVRQMLAPESFSDSDALHKHWFHRTTTLNRQRSGQPVKHVPLSVAINLRRFPGQPNAQGIWQAACNHCGDCVTGCKVGAKNTLDVNYLPTACAAGAELYTRVEVEWVECLADGAWRVHYVAHPDGGGGGTRGTITARRVILSAGALGSTQILLRSAAQGLALSPALGTRFTANGDLLGFGYNTDVQTNIAGYGSGGAVKGIRRVGPTISSAADYRQQGTVANRYLIEEGAIPSALVDALRLTLPAAAGIMPDFAATQRITRDLKSRRPDGALNHSMLYLGIGHDTASGKVELDSQGNAKVVWPQFAQEPFIAKLRAEMNAHVQSFGGKYVESPRASPLFGGAMTTVHPLGGCPMGERAEEGVVNADHQVFDPRTGQAYDGLYVVDGAITPSAIGANPLLTIAALAERAAERFRA